MKFPQPILFLGLVCLCPAHGFLIFTGTNRTNRSGFIGADGKELRKPDRMIVGLHQHHHAHHKVRMLNGRHRQPDAQPDASSTEPVNLALDKAQGAAEEKKESVHKNSEQQKEQDIERAATCSKAKHHTSVHKACKHFMRDLCHLGENGGGDLATMQEVKDYCESFYIEAGDGKDNEGGDGKENEYKPKKMSEDYEPPPMPWSNKKKEGPLPEHGYWGDPVEHDDMKTFTGDWQMEFGPRQGGEQNIQEICKRYPNSEWCRIYADRYGPAYGYGGDGGADGSSSWSDHLPGMPGHGKHGGGAGSGADGHGGDGGGFPWSGGSGSDGGGSDGSGFPWGGGGKDGGAGGGSGGGANGGAGGGDSPWWAPWSAAWRSSDMGFVTILSLGVVAITAGLP